MANYTGVMSLATLKSRKKEKKSVDVAIKDLKKKVENRMDKIIVAYILDIKSGKTGKP